MSPSTRWPPEWCRRTADPSTALRRDSKSRSQKQCGGSAQGDKSHLDLFVIPFASATAAQDSSVAPHFALEVDAFTTFGADDPLALVAWQLFRWKRDFHPLFGEEIFDRHLAVGEHLLLVLALDLRMHLPRQCLGAFLRRDSNRSARLQIDERRRNFSPVAELQRAFAQPAAGHHPYGIGGATIDLNEGDEPFAVFAVGIVDAQELQAAHCQSHAEYLSGAKMSVSNFGVAQQLIQALHQRTPHCWSESLSVASSTNRPLTFTVNLSPALGRKVTRAGWRSQCGASQLLSGTSPMAFLPRSLRNNAFLAPTSATTAITLSPLDGMPQ